LPGLVPGADGAGEIVSVGEGSKWESSIGAAVFLTCNRDWIDGDVSVYNMHNALGAGDINGTLSQYMIVKDPWVVRAPKNLSFEEIASLPGAGGTAINVLQSLEIKKGTTVLTQGTGGVSCFVIQVSNRQSSPITATNSSKYAAALGARVIATSSTDEKLQFAKKLGASELINYKTTPDWATEVLRLTNGKGVDLVCDVGGSGTLEATVKALRQGGTACLVGFLTPPKPVDVLLQLIAEAKTCKSSQQTLDDTGDNPADAYRSEGDPRLQQEDAGGDGGLGGRARSTSTPWTCVRVGGRSGSFRTLTQARLRRQACSESTCIDRPDPRSDAS